MGRIVSLDSAYCGLDIVVTTIVYCMNIPTLFAPAMMHDSLPSHRRLVDNPILPRDIMFTPQNSTPHPARAVGETALAYVRC